MIPIIPIEKSRAIRPRIPAGKIQRYTLTNGVNAIHSHNSGKAKYAIHGICESVPRDLSRGWFLNTIKGYKDRQDEGIPSRAGNEVTGHPPSTDKAIGTRLKDITMGRMGGSEHD